MPRANLGQLLDTVAAERPHPDPGTAVATSAADEAPAVGHVGAVPTAAPTEPPAASPARPARSAPTSAPADGDTSNGPLYLRLVRKDARLREQQYADLTTHARRLNRARPKGGARITENTLIRVAIDLLLTHIDAAEGASEEELRVSIERSL